MQRQEGIQRTISTFPYYSTDLVKLMRWIGLPAPDSICYGYMAACVPALFLRQRQRVNLRLFQMYALQHFATDKDLEGSFAAYIAKSIATYPPYLRAHSHNVEAIKEIEAFCQAIQFHYLPQLYGDWFPPGAAPRQYDLLKTLPLVMPKSLTDILEKVDGVPTVAASWWFFGALNLVELTVLLSQVRAAAKVCTSPVLLELSSTTHSAVLTYDVFEEKWIIGDVQELELDGYQDDKEQALLVQDLFSEDNKDLILSMRFLALSQATLQVFLNHISSKNEFQNLFVLNVNKTLCRGYYNEHILHVAAQAGSLFLVKAIDGMDPSLKNTPSLRSTPLQEAVLMGNLEVVKYLMEVIDLGSSQDIPNALLEQAVEANQIDCVKLILTMNPDSNGLSAALKKACSMGYYDILFELLESKVAVRLRKYFSVGINLYLTQLGDVIVHKEIAALVPQRDTAMRNCLIMAWQDLPPLVAVLTNIKKIDYLYLKLRKDTEKLKNLLPTLASAYLLVCDENANNIIKNLLSHLKKSLVGECGLFALKRKSIISDDEKENVPSQENNVTDARYNKVQRLPSPLRV